MLQRIKPVLHRSLQYLFPDVCVLCGKLPDALTDTGFFRESLHLCRRCVANLPLRLPNQFALPQEPVDSSVKKSSASSPERESLRIYTPFFYEGDIVQGIRRLKFHEGLYVASTLGFFMSRVAQQMCEEVDVLVPMPLGAGRAAERGYNQAELLAQGMTRFWDKPMVTDLLVRTRNTGRQSSMESVASRSENVRGAFAVSSEWDVFGMSVLLVDDVVTTGATIEAAAAALLAAGAIRVQGIAAASGRIGNLVGIIQLPDEPEPHVFEPS